MEKIFRFFGKEYRNVNQAAFLLGIFSLLSQVLGLFRDRAIAHFIGPSPLLDAYYAAFRVPDLIFISIASLASVTVLIPFMSEREGNKTLPSARDFISNVFTVFSLVLVLVSVLVYILMPFVIHIIAPGFTATMQLTTIDLSRIMLLSPIFLGLSNLFGSITQLHRKFFIYALSPIFYNLGIIGGVLLLYPYFGIRGLAVGVVLGAFMHFGIQAFASTHLGFAPRFVWKIDWGMGHLCERGVDLRREKTRRHRVPNENRGVSSSIGPQ
ncbi:MAG: lipid II flippase MurJ [Candidatus Paceibacteria bacterium]